VQREHERGDSPGHPTQWVIQRAKLQKVHLSKSCSLTRDAKLSVNVSSAQQFLVAHTALPYSIHMHEILKVKNARALHGFGRAARVHFCTPELDAPYCY